MVDYSGREFYNIKVIKRIGTRERNGKKRSLWLCQCKCGKYIKLDSSTISGKSQKSCGCIRKETGYKIKECKYEIFSDYAKGLDGRGRKFIVDLEDYEKIKDYCWYVNKDKKVQTKINGKMVYLHRFIMNLNDRNYEVDHINHDRTDNRKINLRIVTHAENMKNVKTPKHNTSGRVGVRYLKNKNKWEAGIHANGKYISKTANSFEDAVEKRIELEKEYFGKMRNKNL